MSNRKSGLQVNPKAMALHSGQAKTGSWFVSSVTQDSFGEANGASKWFPKNSQHSFGIFSNQTGQRWHTSGGNIPRSRDPQNTWCRGMFGRKLKIFAEIQWGTDFDDVVAKSTCEFLHYAHCQVTIIRIWELQLISLDAISIQHMRWSTVDPFMIWCHM